MSKYRFTDDMKEISGFGGGYEQTCRTMLVAALEWFDSHPHADPKFHGYKGIYGIISEDNDEVKELSRVVQEAAGYDCTGAMHQAVVGSAFWIRTNGWDAYVAKMTHPQGEAGILKEKLQQYEEELTKLRKRCQEQQDELRKRGDIIAKKVLHWDKYSITGNDEQRAYGPDPDVVKNKIGPGDFLSRLVDEAIAEMWVE